MIDADHYEDGNDLVFILDFYLSNFHIHVAWPICDALAGHFAGKPTLVALRNVTNTLSARP